MNSGRGIPTFPWNREKWPWTMDGSIVPPGALRIWETSFLFSMTVSGFSTKFTVSP